MKADFTSKLLLSLVVSITTALIMAKFIKKGDE